MRLPIGTAIALGLKLVKSASALKVLLFGASAFAYSWLLTWETAAVLLFGLLIHEYGHVYAMRRAGMPVKGVYFIPFMGAVAIGALSRSRREEAVVALMGPAFGLLSLLPLALGYLLTGEVRWLGWLALLSFINLINLAPIGILDGGRITKSIALSLFPKAGWLVVAAGLIFGAAAAFALGSITWFIILGLSAFEFRATREREMEPMSGSDAATLGGLYLVCVLALLAALVYAGTVRGADILHAL